MPKLFKHKTIYTQTKNRIDCYNSIDSVLYNTNEPLVTINYRYYFDEIETLRIYRKSLICS